MSRAELTDEPPAISRIRTVELYFIIFDNLQLSIQHSEVVSIRSASLGSFEINRSVDMSAVEVNGCLVSKTVSVKLVCQFFYPYNRAIITV